MIELILTPRLAHHEPVYWLMMQLAMILGSFTGLRGQRRLIHWV